MAKKKPSLVVGQRLADLLQKAAELLQLGP
jgi:hypothetical protein